MCCFITVPVNCEHQKRFWYNTCPLFYAVIWKSGSVWFGVRSRAQPRCCCTEHVCELTYGCPYNTKADANSLLYVHTFNCLLLFLVRARLANKHWSAKWTLVVAIHLKHIERSHHGKTISIVLMCPLYELPYTANTAPRSDNRHPGSTCTASPATANRS